MTNYSEKAKSLLESKQADVIIGYEAGKTGVPRPVIVSNPEQTNRLIYNENCTANLALYLTKHEVKERGKMAIFATLPVMRSIMMLIAEQQLTFDKTVIIGLDSSGNMLDFVAVEDVEAYINKSDLANNAKDQEIINKLKAMSMSEKFEFWKQEMSRCIRCYACRQTCPMCYCVRCTTECNQPQWIPVASTAQGNLDWHVLRAMHLAGRCVSCGECGKACPVDIPCHLLTMFLAEASHEHFGVWAGTNHQMDSVMSSYNPIDKENIII